MTSTQTFILSLVVLIGGGLLIRFPPPSVDPAILIPFVTGAIGTVLGYVFSGRAATETAAHIQASQPTITATGEPPTIVATPTPPPAVVPEG